MFGDIMSLRRPSAPAPPPAPPQILPRFLLPSLRIPFRRRHTSEPRHPVSSSSSPTTSEPPSLSTSPASPISLHSPPSRRLSCMQPATLRCGTCSTDLAFHAQIISKCFFGRHGRAYLVSPPSANPSPINPGGAGSPSRPLSEFGTLYRANEPTASELINIRVGAPEDRRLATGDHTVADITCVRCNTVVGWKYVAARNVSQKYKVGKYILETGRVVGFQNWEDADLAWDHHDHGGRVWGGDLEGGEEGREEEEEEEEEERGEEEEEDRMIVFDSEDEDECEDIFAGVWDATVVAKRRRSKAGKRV